MPKKKIIKSATSHAILDPASRKRKADKIATILKQFTSLDGAELLDIGTGAGYIAHHLSSHVGAVTSVDVVDERQETSGYTFRQVSSEQLPFEDSTFDIVVSNHVVEHVTDQAEHIKELMRIVKPEGIVYLATPNRLWVTDPHYRIPFINWMPRRVATSYLKRTQDKVWDIRPITIRKLRRHIAGSGQPQLVIADTMKYPEKYNLDVFTQLLPLTKRLPMSVLRLGSHIAPTILLVVKKNPS